MAIRRGRKKKSRSPARNRALERQLWGVVTTDQFGDKRLIFSVFYGRHDAMAHAARMRGMHGIRGARATKLIARLAVEGK